MFFWVGRILFSPTYFPLFCLCYAYFRWLDDQIDAPDISKFKAELCIQKQNKLISLFVDGIDTNKDNLNPYEKMLILLLTLDKQLGSHLRSNILEMFAALEFDVIRRNKYCNGNSLNDYSRKIGGSFTEFILICTTRKTINVKTIECFRLAGYAAHNIHLLRDFYEDLQLGYINISREDIIKFGFENHDLKSVDINPWVRFRVQICKQYIHDCFIIIKSINSLKVYFLFLIISAPYVFFAQKIEENNYELHTYHENAKNSTFIKIKNILSYLFRM